MAWPVCDPPARTRTLDNPERTAEMTQYTFDFNVAEAVQDQMASITSQIQSMLADLESQVANSIADWNSPYARDAYNVAKQKWDAAAAQMPAALAQAQQALTSISGVLQGVESRGVQMWSN
jgi:uncharacterized protein YukE